MENENNEVKEQSLEEVSDNEIEKKPDVTRPKRVQSEKQIEAFKRAREKRMENITKRKLEQQTLKQDEKVEIETKIVKKAIAIKKKKIKQEKIIEMTQSDESASDYEVPKQKTVRRQVHQNIPPPIPEKPEILFI